MAPRRKQLQWSSSSPGISRWPAEGVGFFGKLWDLILGLPHPLTQPAKTLTPVQREPDHVGGPGVSQVPGWLACRSLE